MTSIEYNTTISHTFLHSYKYSLCIHVTNSFYCIKNAGQLKKQPDFVRAMIRNILLTPTHPHPPPPPPPPHHTHTDRERTHAHTEEGQCCDYNLLLFSTYVDPMFFCFRICHSRLRNCYTLFHKGCQKITGFIVFAATYSFVS